MTSKDTGITIVGIEICYMYKNCRNSLRLDICVRLVGLDNGVFM